MSLFYVEYQDTLKTTAKRLGMFYGTRGALRRIYAFVLKQGKHASDVRALEVNAGAKGVLFFRVYFDDFAVETLNEYILRGKKK